MNPLLSSVQSPFADQGNPMAGPSLADAWSHNAAAFGSWRDRERAKSVEMGLMDPETGWPTQAGVLDVAHQLGNAMLMGTTAPGIRMAGSKSGAMSDTAAFRDWFGKSKIVDDTGKPQVLYHGSASDINQFDVGKAGSGAGGPSEKAIFLTNDRKLASGYADVVGSGYGELSGYGRGGMEGSSATNAGVVYPVLVKAENPYVSDLTYYNGNNFAREIAKAKAAGHDSIQFPNVTHDGERGVTAVFSPTQVKSATGNSGAFDPKDPRIAAGIAGLTAAGAAAMAQPDDDTSQGHTVFDDALVDILRKYAAPGMIGAGAAAGAATE